MNGKEFDKIIRRLREDPNDDPTLETLYRACFAKLCSTAYSILHNSEDARDVATDVILKAIYLPDDERISNHIGYMITMTRNQSINLLQKRRREISLTGYEHLTGQEIGDDLWLTDINRLLTEEEWKLFVMRALWGLTLKDSGKQLGISYVTVKRRYARILEKIREDYEKNKT